MEAIGELGKAVACGLSLVLSLWAIISVWTIMRNMKDLRSNQLYLLKSELQTAISEATTPDQLATLERKFFRKAGMQGFHRSDFEPYNHILDGKLEGLVTAERLQVAARLKALEQSLEEKAPE
jgi:hypothetical protein